MAVLSIEQLIQKKAQLKPVQVKRVHIDKLGGELEIKRLPVTTYWDLVSKVDQNDTSTLLQAEFDMIYAFCPALHDNRLLEAYDIDIPVDIVPAIFGEDLGAIGQMVTAITEMYGNSEAEELKN